MRLVGVTCAGGGAERFRQMRSLAGAAAIGVLATTALGSSAARWPRAVAAQVGPTCADGTLVNTENGPVCGLATNGITAYLGVPYASPPVGALRWRPPAPLTPSTTTFQATRAGLNCPQPPFPAGSTSTTTRSEDCLTLNMFVPANAGTGLPVMVEIHGGGFLIGAPPNGAHLAAAGHVIVVAIHYRLGVLGFLAHKALGEHSGDYGSFITGRLLNKITLMIGVARDEFNGGLYTSLVANSPARYRELLQQQFGDRTSAVLALYPSSRFPNASPFIAYRTVMADAFSVCPALVADERLAKHIPVYAFENDNGDTPQNTPTLPLGAFHNAENPFLFPSSTLTLGPNQSALGDQVVAQWSGFARTGNPTVDGTPRWTLYNDERLVMSLVPGGGSALTPTTTLNMQHNCGFWNAENRTASWAPR